jgi:hypothetical protein
VRGRQHGIADDDVAVGDVLRDLEVVLDRLQRPGIAVQPDMADARQRHEIDDALGEPQAGTQDRHDHQLLALEQGRLHRLDGRGDVALDQRQGARGVVAQQQADLAQQAAEVGARRLPVAHLGKLVLHQRMADDVDRMRQRHTKSPLLPTLRDAVLRTAPQGEVLLLPATSP